MITVALASNSRRYLATLFSLAVLFASHAGAQSIGNPPAAPTANVDPALDSFVKGFKSRGAMDDGSKPLNPEEAMKCFTVAPGLKIEAVAHEPRIMKPIEMRFDERGRLWVVQYLQFPFPAGLKIKNYDEYLRAVYDKVPEPPPRGVSGRDKITVLEDRDGDGVFETQKDFLTGLNMATSALPGHGGVWVMNPPYLLFYPVKDRGDAPAGDPEVRLSGFGLEDTHALANGLRWGPDGWLYGATGSTVTANVSGIRWLGQAIWRYHPDTRDFEIFAEGGGNTWGVEFDEKGRLFSGTNSGNLWRGLHFVQGGYYVKNFAKHGPLTNPYAFGYFEHMTHRQTATIGHVCQPFIVYEGGAFPRQFNGQVFTGNALSNRLQLSTLEPDGTTFATADADPLVTSTDRWFRPVALTSGPDGAIYIADWYDSRLTNLDPRDTWDHEHGRIYRLSAANAGPMKPFDLGRFSNEQLIETLKDPNKWFRQTALQLFYDRHDPGIAPKLSRLVMENSGQFALECFWALNASGGFTDEVALEMLGHKDQFVRCWTVRLLGDRCPPLHNSSSTRRAGPLPEAIANKLAILARTETEPEVRAQLASSACRLVARDALPILTELFQHSEDAGDKHIPLLEWWALESKAGIDRTALLDLLKDANVWRAPLFREFIVARLAERYTAERKDEGLETAAKLLALAPGPEFVDELIKGMASGLQGNRVSNVPPALQQQLAHIWDTRPHTALLVSFAMRLNYTSAGASAVDVIADPKTSAAERKSLLETVSERQIVEALPVITRLLKNEKAESARLDLLNALSRFNTPEAGQTILDEFPSFTAKLRTAAITVLSSRADWARALLEKVDRGEIKKESVSIANLLTMRNLGDARTDEFIKKHWGNLRASSKQKEDLIKNLRLILAVGGDATKGRELFKTTCAVCHTLKGEGAKIGPDLTGYERDNLDFMLPAIVDPSLAIREEYTIFTLTTKEDQIFSGFVPENTPQFVTILDAAGAKTKVAREDIKSFVASPISLMPEGLLDSLTTQQTRDLFAYLRAK